MKIFSNILQYLAISRNIRQYLATSGDIWKYMAKEDFLFIKQGSILNVIRENKIISSANLRRQFLGIKDRSFRYHLKRLQDMGFIRKRGTTKGVYYEII